jgi:hypothetical protein
MIASFEYELTREDDCFYLEVIYSAARYQGEYEAELVSVTLDGAAFTTTVREDDDIMTAVYEQLASDYEDQEAARGDYINDMREDR